MYKNQAEVSKMRRIMSKGFMKSGMPLSEMLRLTKPMIGKTAEEKEAIAEKLIEEYKLPKDVL